MPVPAQVILLWKGPPKLCIECHPVPCERSRQDHLDFTAQNKHLLDETESNMQFIVSGQGSLHPLLFCMVTIKFILNEIKSNKCFIIPKNRFK